MAEAIKERGGRIFGKFGNVMLETKGMTKAGIDRKAAARTLFSKLLFLAGMRASKPSECQCHKTNGKIVVGGIMGLLEAGSSSKSPMIE